MQSFDVLVIGAGPAGSAAAFTAARAGLRTALVDKAAFPRNKLCGGGITGRSRRYMQEIFGQDLPAGSFETRSDITFAVEGRQAGVLKDAPPVYLTMRRDFDNSLFRWALAAGAEDFSGCAIKHIDSDSRQITLKDGRLLAGQVLIGADGVNSQVAKALFGRAFDPNTIGFGLEIEASPKEMDPAQQPLLIDFSAAQGGYGWIFPKTHSTTIGIGGPKAMNPDIKRAMAMFATQCHADDDPKRFKGHFIPFGDYRKRPARGAVLLCGDAAGLVDPVTGEGIAYAMHSGQMAALSAAQALQAKRPKTAAALYQRKLKPIHRSLQWANLIRRLIYSQAFYGYFEKGLKRSGTLRWRFMALLAGDEEYGQIILGVLRRLPAVGWQALTRRLRR